MPRLKGAGRQAPTLFCRNIVDRGGQKPPLPQLKFYGLSMLCRDRLTQNLHAILKDKQ